MTSYVAVDASRFSPYHQSTESPLWWGTTLLVTIQAVVYAAFIASYFYLRQAEGSWPPGNLHLPLLLWPTVGTGLRLASEPCMWLANRSAKRDNNPGVVLWLGIATVLAIGWMVIMVEHMFGLTYSWQYGTYGSLVWTMVAWAFVCMASAIIWAIVNWIWALGGHFNRYRLSGLQSLKIYWSMQFVGWIFFWLVIFFGPRVFHKP